MPDSSLPFTVDLLVVLAAASLLAIVGQRLRLAIIPLYLITGVLIGPDALGLVHSPHSLEVIGQLAVILLLFGIGLELDLTLIRHDWVRLLLIGLISGLLGVALGWPVIILFGLWAPAALAVAIALATSSTAVVLRTLDQRRELTQVRGRLAIAATTVQDLLVLGMLSILPALRSWMSTLQAQAANAATIATTQPVATTLPSAATLPTTLSATLPTTFPATLPTTLPAKLPGAGALVQRLAEGPWGLVGLPVYAQILVNVGILALLIIVGRWVLPRLLAESAKHQSTESMMILSVALAIGSAVITEWLGMGAALGAFLAGFMLSATPFRYHLRGQMIPLRNLFLAIFLTTLGMQMNPHAVLASWWIILLGVLALVIVKLIVTAGVCWALGATGSIAVAVGFILAQGGEFSLVVIQAARDNGLLAPKSAGNVIAVIVLSLILTPALIRLGHLLARWPKLAATAPWTRDTKLRDTPGSVPGSATGDGQAEQAPVRPHVIVAGYGPVGRSVTDRLVSAGLDVVIVELNPTTIQRQTQLGRQIIYGDISSPEILEAARITQAAALVITVPDQDAAIRASAIARGLNPSLFIAARTSIVSSGLLARQAGADHVTIDELATAESMQHAVLDRLLPIVAGAQ